MRKPVRVPGPKTLPHQKAALRQPSRISRLKAMADSIDRAAAKKSRNEVK